MWRALRADFFLRLGWMVLAAAALDPASALGETLPTLGVPGVADDNRLWDDGHRLSAPQRAALRRRLAAAAHRVGSPVFLFVADGLRRETAAALAARTFAARGLGAAGDGANPVLLLVSPRDHAAAIETGKGSAAIVPEIDAVRIIKQLERSLHDGDLSRSLTEALGAIAASAEATAARRRPSSVDEDLPPADDRSAGQPGDSSPGPAAPAAAEAPAAEKKGRSRLPIAAGVAVLVLLGLALRRRRHVTVARSIQPSTPRPPRPRQR